MLGLQMAASGRVPYPSRSSSLCCVSKTISSITSGLRMSLIWSGKKSNIGTKKQPLLLHTLWGQGSLAQQQVSLEGCGQTRLSWQRLHIKVSFDRDHKKSKKMLLTTPNVSWRTHTRLWERERWLKQKYSSKEHPI